MRYIEQIERKRTKLGNEMKERLNQESCSYTEGACLFALWLWLSRSLSLFVFYESLLLAAGLL